MTHPRFFIVSHRFPGCLEAVCSGLHYLHSLRFFRFLRLVCGVDNAAIYNFPSAMLGLFFLGEEDLVEPAVFAVSAQVHVGVYSRNNARLAVLPDGVLALPVDFGLAA